MHTPARVRAYAIGIGRTGNIYVPVFEGYGDGVRTTYLGAERRGKI